MPWVSLVCLKRTASIAARSTSHHSFVMLGLACLQASTRGGSSSSVSPISKAPILTFFAQAIALVAFLIRNAAGASSLFGFTGRADEAFPILFFLRGDFEPLAERAVVDLRGGLIVVVCHKKVLRFSISRNGGTLAQLQKGTMKEPQSVWITPFRIAANPLKRQLQYSLVRRIPLSHQ